MTTPEATAFEADWTGAEALPLRVANAILTQIGLPSTVAGTPDGIYLTFGHTGPPTVYGSQELMDEQLAALRGRIPVEPVARIFMPLERVQELQGILTTALANFHGAQAQAQELLAKQEKARG